MDFAAQVRRGHENARRRVFDAVQKITIDAVNDIILSSPVDTGRFRGNWQASLNTIDYTTTTRADAAGDGPRRDAQLELSGMAEGDVFFFANSLPYARRLEYGYSLQAPSPPGIVRRAAMRSQDTQRQVFAQLRP